MNHEGTKNTKKKKKEGSREQGAGENVQKSPVSSPVRSEKPRSQSIPNLDDWLEIGKIVSPQGLTGELRVYPNTDFPERFEEPGKRWLYVLGKRNCNRWSC